MAKDGFAMMRHALGVALQWDRRWSKPYRNHYVAGGSDASAWDTLVANGYAEKRRAAGELTGGSPLYVVTEAGRTAALEGITFKRRWGYGKPANGGCDD